VAWTVQGAHTRSCRYPMPLDPDAATADAAVHPGPPLCADADSPLRRNDMKNTALKGLLAAAVLIPVVAVYAQPRPGNPTTATVITKAEIDKISATEQNQTTRDENARVVDIGDGWSMELGIVHRSKQHVLTVGQAAQAARGSGNAQAGAAGRGTA